MKWKSRFAYGAATLIIASYFGSSTEAITTKAWCLTLMRAMGFERLQIEDRTTALLWRVESVRVVDSKGKSRLFNLGVPYFLTEDAAIRGIFPKENNENVLRLAAVDPQGHYIIAYHEGWLYYWPDELPETPIRVQLPGVRNVQAAYVQLRNFEDGKPEEPCLILAGQKFELVYKIAAINANLQPVGFEGHPRFTRVRDLDLDARTVAALNHVGINSVGDLIQRSPRDVLRIPQIGMRSLREIQTHLANRGLSLSADFGGN